ncbi:ABC transporter substrate-binding protein [Agrobacterium genomosp. 3 str. RTP8]|uniref:ABC transporter substrate-binding protein n=1 Tax=Agrobacterium tomkonis TaxID=1183410 RepID=UPI001CD9D9A7|nr:ABC transporter substrate-binding protein [Agrobacterium tomkonis RTP8]
MQQMNRRTALQLGGGILALGLTGGRAYASAPKELKIGVIQPQQGDCAQWGVPITRAVEMWAEDLSGQDGFLAGDGERYALKVTGYDNVCYAAGDELKAARRAVLDDGVRYLLQTYTPSCRQAIGPLTNDAKVLVTSYGAGFLSQDFPFLLGGETGQPTGNMLVASHVIETHPEIKRVAILTADTSFAQAARSYIQAGVAVHGSQAEIVYDGSYSAAATNDMLGLLTPLIDAKPDFVYEAGFTPGQKATMVSTLEQLGFTGIYASETWEVAFIQQAGLLDAVAGRLFSGPAVDAQEPTFSPRANAFYKRYVEKYGVAEWASWASATYAALGVFEVGLKASPSIEPETVMKTLYAMETVDHPIFGPSKWGGEEVFGANHHLYTPQPVYGVEKDGSSSISGVVPTSEWWAKNKLAALPVLKAGGQVYVK